MKHSWRLARIQLFCLPLLFAAGCSSVFNEVHYFKSTDEKNHIVNYYRLRVTGGSFLSSARYLSGVFDATAVETYFNEFSQPADGTFIPTSAPNNTSVSADQKTTSVEEVSTVGGSVPLQNKHYLLLFSTNSDAIATQISSIATSQDIAAGLVKLVSHDTFANQSTANNNLAVLQAKNLALAQLGDNLLTPGAATPNLTDDSQGIAYQKLLAYTNALAADLGNTTPFTDLDAANTWLQSHRASLLKGGQ